MARAFGKMNTKLHWHYPYHIARIHFHPWIEMLKFPNWAGMMAELRNPDKVDFLYLGQYVIEENY